MVRFGLGVCPLVHLSVCQCSHKLNCSKLTVLAENGEDRDLVSVHWSICLFFGVVTSLLKVNCAC